MLQTDWSGGTDSAPPYPVHGTDETDWTKYASKDASVDASTTPGQLTNSTTSDSATETSNADFAAGATSQAVVSGGDVVLGTTVAAGSLVTAFDSDGIVQSDPTSVHDEIHSIAIDSSYIYLGGWQNTGGDCSTGSYCWRVEKRDITTGALVTAFDTDGIVQSDPTSGSDQINSIAIDASYIYLGGYQSSGCSTGGVCWRVEKRDITTGALVTAFDTDGIVTSDPTSGTDILYSIAVDSSYIYLGGYQWAGECSTGDDCWRVEKRDITTGALVTAFDSDGIVTSDPTSGGDRIHSIAIDSSYIYLGGYQSTGGDCSTGGVCWRVEKRDISTGALVTSFDSDGIVQSDPTSSSDWLKSIAVDSSYIYLGGYQATGGDCSTGNNCWRLEKRDITTGALVTAFDSDGIVTSDPTSGSDQIQSIAIDSSFIYLGGWQGTGGGCSTGSDCWRVEKRDITTGALVTAFDSDGIVQSDPSNGQDWLYSIAVDSSYIYLGGHRPSGCSLGNRCWRLEKRNNSNAYYTSGDFTSQDIDLGQLSDFTTLDFTIAEPTDTDVQFRLRSATTQGSLGSATWYGPTGTSDYYVSTGTSINSTHDSDQWFQYKSFFTTSDTTATGTFSDITLNAQYYPLSATLTSSWYDTGKSNNTVGSLIWNETLPTNTKVKFQIRTAPDNSGSPGTPTSFCGPDNAGAGCDTAAYFSDNTGAETIDADFTDNTNDQWIQYKVFLETTDNIYTPTLADVTMAYAFTTSSGFSPDTTTPEPIQDFIAVAQEDGAVLLTWTNPPDADFFQVRIYRSQESSFTPSTVTEIAQVQGSPSSPSSYLDTNIEPGVTYTYLYQILTEDIRGNLQTGLFYPSVSILTVAPSAEEVIEEDKEPEEELTEEQEEPPTPTGTPRITDPSLIKKDSLIRGPDNIKIYLVNERLFRRHILNPDIFNLYGYEWSSVKEVSQEVLSSYIYSSLHRVSNDYRVFLSEELDGTALRSHLNMTPSRFEELGYKWGEVFIINEQEQEYYQQGEDIV